MEAKSKNLTELGKPYAMDPREVRAIARSIGIEPTEVHPRLMILTPDEIERVTPLLEEYARTKRASNALAHPA